MEQGEGKQEVPIGTGAFSVGQGGIIPGRDSAPGRLGAGRASHNFGVPCLSGSCIRPGSDVNNSVTCPYFGV